MVPCCLFTFNFKQASGKLQQIKIEIDVKTRVVKKVLLVFCDLFSMLAKVFITF